MKIIFKRSITWIIVIELFCFLLLFSCGFKIIYAPHLDNNWEAIGATGQWASTFVGFLIPLAVIYIESKLNQSKEEIGESNSALFNEINDFRNEHIEKGEDFSTPRNSDSTSVSIKSEYNSIKKNKEKALKFIIISIATSTNKVAQHLGISKEESFDLLVEMMVDDKSIKCVGKCSKKKMDKLLWKKKR